MLGPSCVADEVESRFDAVGDLMEDFTLLKTLQERLKKLPDMDKMLARIHSLSLKKVGEVFTFETQKLFIDQCSRWMPLKLLSITAAERYLQFAE